MHGCTPHTQDYQLRGNSHKEEARAALVHGRVLDVHRPVAEQQRDRAQGRQRDQDHHPRAQLGGRAEGPLRLQRRAVLLAGLKIVLLLCPLSIKVGGQDTPGQGRSRCE